MTFTYFFPGLIFVAVRKNGVMIKKFLLINFLQKNISVPKKKFKNQKKNNGRTFLMYNLLTI